MRIADSVGYRTLLNHLNMLNNRLEQANEQVSSGKRLTHLYVAPADSAEMVQLNDQLSQLDQYQTNADTSGYFLQVSESALNSMYDLITAIFTRGSDAANSYNDAGVRATLATEIRSQRDQILSLANTQVKGRYLFSGSQVTTVPFAISGDTVTYQGDAAINTINISNGLQVEENIPGATVFSPVFSTVEDLLAAVDSGDLDAIRSSLSQFAATLATVSQVRAHLGIDLAKLRDSAVSRQTQQTNIETRQAHVGNANMAAAITQTAQTQTALQAALTAGSMVGQKNLFDFLG